MLTRLAAPIVMGLLSVVPGAASHAAPPSDLSTEARHHASGAPEGVFARVGTSIAGADSAAIDARTLLRSETDARSESESGHPASAAAVFGHADTPPPGDKLAVRGVAERRASALSADKALGPLQAGRGLIGVWDAFPYTGWIPASPQIAAGPTSLVATANSRIRVYDRDGERIRSASLRTWFEPLLEPIGINGIFVTEPWTLYDTGSGRFIVSAVASRSDGLSMLLLAVSNTSDPLGRWCVFGSDARLDGNQPSDNFAGNPRVGVNADAVIVTANMAARDTGFFVHSKARFFAKSVVYDPSCSSTAGWNDVWGLQNDDGSRVWDLRPVHGAGSDSDAYLLNGRLDQGTALTLWRVPTSGGELPLGSPARAPEPAVVPVPAFSLPPDAEQPGTTTLVSTGSASLHAVTQQGRSLWTAHPIACTWSGDTTLRSCVRWYEIDIDSPRLRQSGSFGEPFAYVFEPEIVPDRDGNAVIAFNRASREVPLEGAYVCRRASAAAGTTDQELVTLVEGQGCYVRLGANNYNVWGVHNGIARDPVTDRAWVHIAYAYGGSTDCAVNTWRTAIADVSCAPISVPSPPPAGATPVPTLQPLVPGPAAPTTRPPLASSCQSVADIMLVLDGSGSIPYASFETVRAFSRAFVTALGVGDQGAHVGIVQFGSPGTNRLEVGLTGDMTALYEAIARMVQNGGSTDMDDGLQIGLDELRTHGRPGIPKMIVLMSDGQPNQGDPEPVAEQAKTEGVRILTIGVGYGIDANLMKRLATAPPDVNFYFAEEFDALMELLDQLVVDLCPTPSAPTAVPTANHDPRLTYRAWLPLLIKDPECPPKDSFVDVALVLDASTSMLAPSDDGRPKYEVVLDAARAFASGLRLEPGKDQLSVVAFNSQDRLLQPLTSDPDRVDQVLRAFTPIRQQSRLEMGIRRATLELTGEGHRSGNNAAMIVLSDGNVNPSEPTEVYVESWAAKSAGIAVYVVGIGPDMNVSTLEPTADPGRFFPAATDADLAPIFFDLVRNVSCPPEGNWPYYE